MSYKNKEWLEDKYINQEKTLREIAKICDCGHSTIQRWTDFYNIKKRTTSENFTGKGHPNWKGGKSKEGHYITVYKPDHPKAHKSRIPEHILIAEENLGRFLKPEERVHHINFNKLDNRIENLYIFKTSSKHQKIKKQIFELVEILIKKNIIGFDKEKEIYFTGLIKMKRNKETKCLSCWCNIDKCYFCNKCTIKHNIDLPKMLEKLKSNGYCS